MVSTYIALVLLTNQTNLHCRCCHLSTDSKAPKGEAYIDYEFWNPTHNPTGTTKNMMCSCSFFFNCFVKEVVISVNFNITAFNPNFCFNLLLVLSSINDADYIRKGVWCKLWNPWGKLWGEEIAFGLTFQPNILNEIKTIWMLKAVWPFWWEKNPHNISVFTAWMANRKWNEGTFEINGPQAQRKIPLVKSEFILEAVFLGRKRLNRRWNSLQSSSAV